MRYRRIPNLGDDYLQTKQRIHIIERIVQAIGFNPDYPYTLTVSDGTRNTVEIGKIGTEYGIKIVNNAGNTIVFADGHITADGITTGTLDASVVNVTNINASNINTGTLNASVVNVENIDADEITTGTLDADRIASRSLDADKIKSHDITADELSTGELITQSAQIGSAVITTAHIDSIDAGKITTGTLDAITINLNGVDLSGYLGVGGTSQPSYLTIQRDNSSGGNAYLRWVGGSKMWSDTSNRIGINSLGTPMYIYVDSTERIVINSSGQNLIRGGLQVTADGGSGNVNIEGACRVDGNFYIGSGTSGYFSFNGSEYELEANFRVNGYQTHRSTMYMNDHDIRDVDEITAYTFTTRSEVFTGNNYKEIIGSIEPDLKKEKSERIKKLGKGWEELNHDTIHSSLSGKPDEKEKTMSNSRLVMVHNTALLDLINRVEELESQVKNLKKGK